MTTAAAGQVASNAVIPPDAAAASPATMPVIRIVPATAAPTGMHLVADTYRTALVCRTMLEAGSLIIRRKACLTRRQSDYVDDQNERFAQSTVASGVSGQSGNGRVATAARPRPLVPAMIATWAGTGRVLFCVHD